MSTNEPRKITKENRDANYAYWFAIYEKRGMPALREREKDLLRNLAMATDNQVVENIEITLNDLQGLIKAETRRN